MAKSYGDLLGYVHKGKHYCVGCAEQMARDRGLRISDDYLIQYLTKSELSDYRNSGSQVLSITVVGKK